VEIRPGTIEANGLTFGILECGEPAAPLVLCLHGFPDSAQTWRHLLPELAAAGFRAVAPWLRGYAPTDIPADGDYGITTLAADANALHAALGGDGDAVLIGHDWGAMTSYAAAATAPDRWRRVVALAVPPPATAAAAFTNYAQLKRSFYIFLFQTPLAEFVVPANDLAFIDGLWRDWSPGYDAGTDLSHVKAALAKPDNVAAAIGYYRAMFTGQGMSNAVPTQPTLYLHGDTDGAFGVEGVTGSDAELPTGSRVDIVEGVGHFLHLEQPADIGRRIVDWVTTR
jgi:pimeloyl-ACP methyl ester carboxylesterase